jgi:transcriptional regulator with XRE-family HTH domain
MTNLGAFKLKAFRLRRTARTVSGGAQARVTQAELAALAGVTPAMISFLETGSKQPSLKVAARLEQLGVCEAADWTRPARCGKCGDALGIITEYCDQGDCPFSTWLPEQTEQAAA